MVPKDPVSGSRSKISRPARDGPGAPASVTIPAATQSSEAGGSANDERRARYLAELDRKPTQTVTYWVASLFLVAILGAVVFAFVVMNRAADLNVTTPTDPTQSFLSLGREAVAIGHRAAVRFTQPDADRQAIARAALYDLDRLKWRRWAAETNLTPAGKPLAEKYDRVAADVRGYLVASLGGQDAAASLTAADQIIADMTPQRAVASH